MEEVVVWPTVALGTTATVLAYAAVGILLGTASGLTPGLHANNFALLLAAFAPVLPGPPIAVGATMLAAGVVHTFLDVVPSLTLGVPDPAMAPMALPGHQLVLAGRGREALRLSALGSGVAVLLAIPLSIPITLLMISIYPTLREFLPAVLAVVVLVLLGTEPTVRAVVGGLLAFLLSSALGILTLDLSLAAPLDVGGVLVPLFAGLFGVPVLIDAARGAGVPPQGDDTIALPRRDVTTTALAGSGAGAMVGYLPGVSAAIASVLALPAVPGRSGARGFVVAASGASTANTVFALFALASLGTPRTGVMVALDRTDVPIVLSILLSVVGLAAIAGFGLVILAGEPYLRLVGQVDSTRLSAGIIGLLVVLSALFAGPRGVVIILVATAIGLVPPRIGGRRVHCMGVLLGPLIVGW